MYRAKLFGILVKVEPTSGTDAVPVPALDAVRAIGIPNIQIADLESGSRDDAQNGSLGVTDRAAPAGTYGVFDITVELKGAGVAYSATTGKPECDALLRAAGFARTVVTTAGSESIQYTTADVNTETVTVYGYTSDGKLIKLVGCVAAVKMTLEAAKRGLATFTVTGKVTTITEAAVPALTFDSPSAGVVKPPLFHSAVNNIGSWLSSAATDPLVLRKVDLDFGTVIAARPSAGATDGHAGYAIVDRKVMQTLEIEAGQLTSLDVFAVSKLAGSSAPLTAYQLGIVQYDKIGFATGRFQFGRPKPGAANQIATHSLAGSLVMGSAPTTNREINILFN